jgi:hypothetical protein
MLLRTRKEGNILEIQNNKLGQALNTKQVSEYLSLDPKTVRKYYRELGGIRLGRHYRFFEKEICNAVQKQKWNEMDCPSEEGWGTTEQSLSHEERCNGLGSQNAAKTRERLVKEDRHGLYR